MASQTTHYSLNKPAGTDYYNHLTYDNPNMDAIDAGMWANKQNSVQVANMSLQENTIAITRDSSAPNTFRFISSVNYAQTHTVTVDGTSVTPTLPDGSALPAKAFIIGSNVLCSLNGTSLTVYTVPSVPTIEDIKATIMDAVYPIGSIFISGVSTDPSTLLGVGTWTRIQGRFIYGVDATHILDARGGAETVALTSANNGPHTHSVSPFVRSENNSLLGSGTVSCLYGAKAGNTTGSSGSGTPHENMPPYICKYIWQRTA